MGSLKNIFISIAVVGLIFTFFTVFATQMANQSIYSITLNDSEISSFKRINSSIDDMHTLSTDIQKAGESISRGDVLSSVYLIPKAAVDIFKMPITAMSTATNMTTEAASLVGIPTYAMTVITVIIIITIVFLIINAIGKRYDE